MVYEPAQLNSVRLRSTVVTAKAHQMSRSTLMSCPKFAFTAFSFQFLFQFRGLRKHHVSKGETGIEAFLCS